MKVDAEQITYGIVILDPVQATRGHTTGFCLRRLYRVTRCSALVCLGGQLMRYPLSNRRHIFRFWARHFWRRHCPSIELVENEFHRRSISAECGRGLKSLETQIACQPLFVVTRIAIVREKRLNYSVECRIDLGYCLNWSIGPLRAAVKHEESNAYERAQKDE